MSDPAFVCVHVADGSPVARLEFSPATEKLPRHLDAACTVCAPQMESLGVNDVRCICGGCLAETVRKQLDQAEQNDAD